MMRKLKVGDVIAPTEEHMAFNRRNGLPKYRAQEVLAILQPGERACDHGFREPVYGYLNDGEQRILVNNQVGSRLSRDRFYFPFKHDAPDPKPDKYARVTYTRDQIVRVEDASVDTLPKGQDPEEGLGAKQG